MFPPQGHLERPPSVADRPSNETDSALALLADPRRRSILRALDECATASPVSLSELAVRIVLESRDRPAEAATSGGEGISPAERRRVEISLRHAHVPSLAAADVVDFDADANVVSLTAEGRTLLERWTAIRGPVA